MWQLAGAPPTPSPGVAGSLRLQASVTPALSSVEQRAGREKESSAHQSEAKDGWVGWWFMPSGGLSADASQGDALLPAQFFLLARRREPVTVTVTRAWRSSLLAHSVLSYPVPRIESGHPSKIAGQTMVDWW